MSGSRSSRAAGSRSVPFLVLDENRLAWTAIDSLKSTIDSGTSPHVVLIYGPSGAGKSHLGDVLLHDFGKRSQLIAAADFADQVARNFKHPGAFDPAAEYSTLDVLIIDDVQQICRQQSAQRVLAGLIDDLRRSETVLVCTSNQPPADLKGLTPRLANRFRGGLCVSVSNPKPASRLKLLNHFCSHLQIAIPAPVLKLFSNELSVSPRELLGMLLRFDDLARQQKVMPDARLARAFLKHEIAPKDVAIEDVARAVARQFGIRLSDMRSKARDQMIAVPRHCAMYLARELTGEHYSRIGEYFNGRSHSTVLHACKQIRRQLEDDAGLRQQLKRVRTALRIAH
jgi:chromosomal replication initiator protein